MSIIIPQQKTNQIIYVKLPHRKRLITTQLLPTKKSWCVYTIERKCSNQNQADPKAGSFVFFKEKESSKKHQCFFTAAPTQHIFFLLKIFKNTIKSLTLKNPWKFFKNLSSLVSIKNYRSNSNSLSLTFHLVNFSLVLICFSEISCFTHKNVQTRIVLEWIFKRLNDACNDENQ